VAGPALLKARRAPSGEQFELVHGDQRVVVVEVGGGLRTYSNGDRAVLDGYGEQELCRSGRGQVLIPWPNRIADGRYQFEGQALQLALDEPDRGNAIHGLVRWSSWVIVEREPDRVLLEHLLHPQPGFPFMLDLRLEYVLADDGLTVGTWATNVGAEICPYGAGAHPYLAVHASRVDDVTLQVPARTALDADERGLPVGAQRVEGTELDFRAPKRVGELRLDHCFTDLERDDDGRAQVRLGNGTTLWANESYKYLMVFTGDGLPDVERRSIAVEPMTCAPNAFRSGDGLIRLEPGETHLGLWGIVPAPR
jgi:aldose 1-epimerase